MRGKRTCSSHLRNDVIDPQRKSRPSQDQIALNASLDLRYVGQGYELTVPAPLPPLQRSHIDVLRQRFDSLHEQAFGHKAEAEPVDLPAVPAAFDRRDMI